MLRSSIALLCAALVSFAADTSSTAVSDARRKLDDIMAKAGISIGGEFKSQYFLAKIEGEGADANRRLNESNEYTSVDFDIKARPNGSIAGRAMLRLHQNWQNFFSDISNPIFSRWISIDASAKDMFRFNLGDFQTQWTPLTLHSPDISVLYEPAVFARQRRLAMDEVFVGNNNRVLQGANVGFDAEVVPLFNEFHASLIGARLRSVQTDLKNGSKVTDAIEYANMSKYLVGANLDAVLPGSLTIGGSWMLLFDHKGSFSNDGSPMGADTIADTMAQRTTVFSVRPGVDIAGLPGWEKWELGLRAEVAGSKDDSVWFDERAHFNPADSSYRGDFFDTVITGSAMRVSADISKQGGRGLSFGVNAAFIRNDRNFRNEMAQSPSFLGHRIMNVENDSLLPQGRDTLLIPNHYSTFDALYHSVFKFTPSNATNLWHKAPFMKNSYSRAIMTQAEMITHSSRNLDPSVQLVMPFGPATPNRQGLTAQAGAGIKDNRIELRGLASVMREVEETSRTIPFDTTRDTTALFPAGTFTQLGGGFSFDVAAAMPALRYPLVLSGSLVRSTMENTGPDAFPGNDAAIASDFINAGLVYTFWKRASLLAGVQMIATTYRSGGERRGLLQTHWTGGLEWRVGEAASVVGSVGRISVSPDAGALGIAPTTLGAVDQEFSQWLVDLSLRVAF